jgi:hypothetical protein
MRFLHLTQILLIKRQFKKINRTCSWGKIQSWKWINHIKRSKKKLLNLISPNFINVFWIFYPHEISNLRIWNKHTLFDLILNLWFWSLLKSLTKFMITIVRYSATPIKRSGAGYPGYWHRAPDLSGEALYIFKCWFFLILQSFMPPSQFGLFYASLFQFLSIWSKHQVSNQDEDRRGIHWWSFCRYNMWCVGTLSSVPGYFSKGNSAWNQTGVVDSTWSHQSTGSKKWRYKSARSIKTLPWVLT